MNRNVRVKRIHEELEALEARASAIKNMLWGRWYDQPMQRSEIADLIQEVRLWENQVSEMRKEVGVGLDRIKHLERRVGSMFLKYPEIAGDLGFEVDGIPKLVWGP